MSESFLVRAIGPDGSPVVMVVHPDSQALMPEASEDQDAASARERGDADALGDLSEDDEEEAVAPAPHSHRFGKSAKTMDRAPSAKSEREAEGENSATTSGRQENTAAGQQRRSDAVPNQLPNPTQSQSAKMRDEGVRQNADNQTTPDRPNGMASDMKEREQRARSQYGTARRNLEATRQSASHQCAARLPAQSRRYGAGVDAAPIAAQQRQ